MAVRAVVHRRLADRQCPQHSHLRHPWAPTEHLKMAGRVSHPSESVQVYRQAQAMRARIRDQAALETCRRMDPQPHRMARWAFPHYRQLRIRHRLFHWAAVKARRRWSARTVVSHFSIWTHSLRRKVGRWKWMIWMMQDGEQRVQEA